MRETVEDIISSAASTSYDYETASYEEVDIWFHNASAAAITINVLGIFNNGTVNQSYVIQTGTPAAGADFLLRLGWPYGTFSLPPILRLNIATAAAYVLSVQLHRTVINP